MISKSVYLVPMDPELLEAVVSDSGPNPEEALLHALEEQGLEDEAHEVARALAQLERAEYERLLARIPATEADMLDMKFRLGKREADIGIIYGMTQAAVSYRLTRAIGRMRWLLSVPQVTEEEIRRDLVPLIGVGLYEIDIEILVGMAETTCQSEVTARLARGRWPTATQGRTRHRFLRAIEILEKAGPDYERYARLFRSISKEGKNMLHESPYESETRRRGRRGL